LTLEVLIRETAFSRPPSLEESIQDTFRALVHDEARLRLITEDVLVAIRGGRRCLVLSEWKEHCRFLSEHLAAGGSRPFVLDGGVRKPARDAILEEVRSLPPEKDLLLIATGQYLGEGFDCPQIDTLFLTFPVSFKGKLVQYLGRTMRSHPGKTVAQLYDYADVRVPVLKAMHLKRRKTYETLGLQTDDSSAQLGLLER
jgi:superfamily II DNA or RNA helicase